MLSVVFSISPAINQKLESGETPQVTESISLKAVRLNSLSLMFFFYLFSGYFCFFSDGPIISLGDSNDAGG